MKRPSFALSLLLINYVLALVYLHYLPVHYGIAGEHLDYIIRFPFTIISLPYFWVGSVYFSVINSPYIVKFIASEPFEAVRHPYVWNAIASSVFFLTLISFRNKVGGKQRKVSLMFFSICLNLFVTGFFFLGLTVK